MTLFKVNIIVGVVLGASLGALIRWWLSVKFNAAYESVFLGTLFANILACSLMGFFIGYETQIGSINTVLRVAFLTGFLGSLSTFSTFIGELHGHLILKDWIKLFLGFNLQLGLGLIAFHLSKQLGLSWH